MFLRLGQQVLCCQCHLLLQCLPPAGLVSYGHEAQEGRGQVWWLTPERGADTTPKHQQQQQQENKKREGNMDAGAAAEGHELRTM